jgi:hypothetical protein
MKKQLKTCLDHPRTTQITQFNKSKPLPEIPRPIPEVSVLEPKEVILYPRKIELEALRQQFASSSRVEGNEAQHLPTTTISEMGNEPVVVGSLFEPQSTPKPAVV